MTLGYFKVSKINNDNIVVTGQARKEKLLVKRYNVQGIPRVGLRAIVELDFDRGISAKLFTK